MRKYTFKEVPAEQQHPIVYQEHIPGMDMVRSQQFDILDPEEIVIATVLSQGQAEALISHLNKGEY